MIDKEKHYENILSKIEETFLNELSEAEIYDYVIDQLAGLPHFEWTGIYLLEEESNELVLHPHYVGKHTDHTRIPVGKGVCGSAIADREDKVIVDVLKLDNYLACSAETRSEIVVLIEDEKKIYGQIDVDSDDVGAFDEIDRQYLRKVTDLIAKKIQ